MDPLIIKNEKAVLIVENMKDHVYLAITDTADLTSEVFTLYAKEVEQLISYLHTIQNKASQP